MKNSIFVCLMVMYAIMAQAQQKFSIKGTISQLAYPAKIYLQYGKGESRILDSAVLTNGSFQFKGDVAYPVKASLTLKQNDGNTDMFSTDEQSLYLDKGNITVKGSGKIKTAVIKGGKAQADYLRLQAQLKPLQDKMTPLSLKMRDYYKQNNQKARDSLFPFLAAIRKDMNATELEFIKNNPASYVTLSMMKERSVMINLATFEPMYNNLGQDMKATADGKRMAEKLAIAKRLAPGQPFINFTLNDTEDKPQTLDAFKGKYVLLDFWASWCGPCRAENPHVLKAYQQFKNRNFDVVAVSLDVKKDAWVKAIKEDGMPWTQLSDLKGFKSPVVLEYGIEAIPQNFLLDPQGRIIAQNLRGEELAKKLAEILP